MTQINCNRRPVERNRCIQVSYHVNILYTAMWLYSVLYWYFEVIGLNFIDVLCFDSGRALDQSVHHWSSDKVLHSNQ